MNAQQLFLAGRLLTQLGRRAMRGAAAGAGAGEVPASARTVLAEALVRPGSAIGEIAERTGLLQSHVSAAVAHLRGAGLVMTVADRKDARRTLVRPLRSAAASAAARQSPAGVDAVLVQALTARLGADGARRVAEVTRALEVVVNGLGPEGALQVPRQRPRTGRSAPMRAQGSRA